jgi:subtilisin family serine protease
MKNKPIYLLVVLSIVLVIASCGSNTTSSLPGDVPKEIASSKVTVQSVLADMEKAEYVQGELLVRFKSGIIAASSLKTHQSVGGVVLRKFPAVPNLERVKLPAGLSVKDAVVKYMSSPDVEYAEPNYMRRSSATIPNDTSFGQQWALHNAGTFASGTADADIDAPEAWDITRGSKGIVIAVLDTGIDLNHSDLVGNIWTNPGETSCTDGKDNDGNGFVDDCLGWDFSTCAQFDADTGICTIPKAADNNPSDDNGHGTHVSGIIGAVGNNGQGVSGVMWSVQLMPLKFLNRNGEGTVGDEIAAIDYAVLMKNRGTNINVINASFGGGGFSQAERDAIASANKASILFMAAAGNGGTDGFGDNNDLVPTFPASHILPNIIAVAATDQNDNRAPFSDFGLNTVHVAAPGVFILSTIPTSIFPQGYFFLDGTSMAAPHVSGLAGLLYSFYTSFTPSQIRATILRYVDVLPTLTGWIQTGGRINAYKAVSSLLPPANLTATAVSLGNITLTWTDNATGEDGYKVEKKTGGSFAEIATLPANAQSFTDTSPADGTYRVRAFNNIPAFSFYSNEAAAINAPTNLVAAAVSTTQIALTWSDNSQTEDGYKIERKSQGGNFVELPPLGPNTTTFTDSGLSSNTTYTYRVRAFNTAAGNSQFSNESSATTPPAPGQSTGGGGGCSIGARRDTDTHTAAVDLTMLLLPLAAIALLKRKRRGH